MNKLNSPITVAFYIEHFKGLCNKKFFHDPFSCNHSVFTTASLLMKCMGLKNITPKFHEFSMDIESDLYPFLFVVNGEATENYTVSSPVTVNGYSFIMGGLMNTITRNLFEPTLLLKPLQWDTWMICILSVLACFILLKGARYFVRPYNSDAAVESLTVRLLHLIVENTLTGILVGLYVTHLMAIVNVKPKPHEPFKSIEELSDLVRNRRKVLVNDNLKQSFVWVAISGSREIDGEYPPRWQQLYNATEHNRAIEIKNMQDLCRQLMNNSTLVYVGRLNELEEQCSQYCFWSLPVPDMPLVFRSYAVAKYVNLDEEVNLCVNFIRTYIEAEIRRSKKRKVASCNHQIESNLVDIHSMASAFYILLGGTICGVVIIIGEFIWKQTKIVNKI